MQTSESVDLGLAASGYWMVFYENRSTPDVVREGQKPKMKAGYGRITSRRRPTEREFRDIRAGRWVRSREDGKGPNDPGSKKSSYRPQLAAKQKTVSLEETIDGYMEMSASGKALVEKLRGEPGVRDAEALAASLGRQKKVHSKIKSLKPSANIMAGIRSALDKPDKERDAELDKFSKSENKELSSMATFAKKNPKSTREYIRQTDKNRERSGKFGNWGDDTNNKDRDKDKASPKPRKRGAESTSGDDFDRRGFVNTGNLPRRNTKEEAVEDALKYYEGGGDARQMYIYELHGNDKVVTRDQGNGPFQVTTSDKAYVAVPHRSAVEKTEIEKKIDGNSPREARGGVVDGVRLKKYRERRDEEDRSKGTISAATGGSGQVKIKTPYNSDFIDAVKKLEGKWDRNDKSWSVPKEREKELRALKAKYFGEN